MLRLAVCFLSIERLRSDQRSDVIPLARHTVVLGNVFCGGGVDRFVEGTYFFMVFVFIRFVLREDRAGSESGEEYLHTNPFLKANVRPLCEGHLQGPASRSAVQRGP